MGALYFASGALAAPMLMNISADPRWSALLIPSAICMIAAAVLEDVRRR